jgi:hypothetical protein
MSSLMYFRTPIFCHLILASLLLVASIATAPVARGANDDYQRARQLFLRGRALYNEGKYQPALEHFRQARRFTVSDKIDLSIAFTLEKLGKIVEAAELFEQILRDGAGDVNPQIKTQVQQKLRHYRKVLGTLKVRTPVVGAWIKIDGRAKARTPQRYRLYVRPGEHLFTLSTQTEPDYHSERVVFHPGQLKQLEVEKRVPKQVAAQETAGVPIYKRWWFWTAIGVVAVGATVGIIAGSGGDDWTPTGNMGTIDLR